MASRESPAMRHGESYRSAKEKQVFGRRRNFENEPFFVEEMPGSPVMRGRNNERRNSVEEHLIGGAGAAAVPTARGGVGSEDDELFVQELPASSVVREAPGGGSRMAAETTPTTTADQHRKTTRRTWRIVDDDVEDGNRRDEPADKKDEPPSYESSVSPLHIGYPLDRTSEIPSAASSSIAASDNHERLMVAFAYSPTNPPSPPIQLSPQAKTYLWMASPDSRSLLTATPSESPSSDRLRPAYYTYQQQRAVRIVTGTPIALARDYENEQSLSVKSNNEFSHKYGGIVIAIFFIVFMMLLSLAVKFLIGNSFSQHQGPR